MGKVKLTVTVMNGKSILGINAQLFKDGQDEPVLKIHKEKSFTEEIKNLKGEYTLYVMGTNALSKDAKTIISVEGEQITFDPPIKNPIERKGKSYLVDYSFKAN